MKIKRVRQGNFEVFIYQTFILLSPMLQLKENDFLKVPPLFKSNNLLELALNDILQPKNWAERGCKAEHAFAYRT